MGAVGTVFNGTFFELHLFYLGVDNFIYHTWDDGNWPSPGWTSAALAGEAVENPPPVQAAIGTDPVVFSLPGQGQVFDETHVFYVGVNNTLQHIYWSYPGLWTVAPPIPGAPIPLFFAGSNGSQSSGSGGYEVHLYYVEQDGNIYQTWQPWESPGTGAWTTELLMTFAGGDSVTSTFSAVNYQRTPSNPFDHPPLESHLLYMSQLGGLCQTWWDGSQWNQEPGIPGPKPGGAIPILQALGGTGELDIFFVAQVDGSLQHTWWDGSNWNNEMVLTEYYPRDYEVLVDAYVGSSGSAELHAFYLGRDQGGNLWQSWKARDDLSGTWTREQVSGPVSLLLGLGGVSPDSYGMENVFYCNNGSLDVASYGPNAWSTQTNLPAATAPNGCGGTSGGGNGGGCLPAAAAAVIAGARAARAAWRESRKST